MIQDIEPERLDNSFRQLKPKDSDMIPDDEEAFVMGGATMYRLFLTHADKLYLTRIVSDFVADVWFPEIDEEEWQLVDNEFIPKDEKNIYDLYFQTLIRQK